MSYTSLQELSGVWRAMSVNLKLDYRGVPYFDSMNRPFGTHYDVQLEEMLTKPHSVYVKDHLDHLCAEISIRKTTGHPFRSKYAQ